MDRQVVARLVVLLAIAVLAFIAFSTDVSRIALVAIALPVAFAIGGGLVFGLPWFVTEKSEGHRIKWLKGLDFLEHGTVLAWLELFALWMTGFIAFMGLQGETAGWESPAFYGAAAVGFIAAMANLYFSEEPDAQQEEWMEHPN